MDKLERCDHMLFGVLPDNSLDGGADQRSLPLHCPKLVFPTSTYRRVSSRVVRMPGSFYRIHYPSELVRPYRDYQVAKSVYLVLVGDPLLGVKPAPKAGQDHAAGVL